MGQFGNRISCAKEEICLSTEYSPELMFPNTLISSLAAFYIREKTQKTKRILFWMANNASGEKGTSCISKWKLTRAGADCIVVGAWQNYSRSCSFQQPPSGFNLLAEKHVNLKKVTN